MQSNINKWIIGMIDRLMELFPQTGFAYAFEDLENRNVVEVTELDVFHSSDFKSSMYEEWKSFQATFPSEKILFINPSESFPLEAPLYRVAPKQGSFDLELDIKNLGIVELFSSIPDSNQIKAGNISVVSPVNSTPWINSVISTPSNNSYAMAA